MKIMKKLSLASILILAGIAIYGIATHGQPQSGAKPDPVKVDPKHYKVEFENDHVRVLRITYGPQEKSVMHYHPDGVVTYLTDGNIRMTTSDGKTIDQTGKAGQTTWTPAGAHLPQNIGDKKFEAILVELKK
jgi:quercetin dioxygenase-like cupin family protein